MEYTRRLLNSQAEFSFSFTNNKLKTLKLDILRFVFPNTKNPFLPWRPHPGS